MSVLLYPNPTKDIGLAVTKRAARMLHSLGVPLLALPEVAPALAGLDGQGLPEAQAFAAADQVLTIGGDGTLLRAAPACVRAGKPVLGVNLGRTGFLATCEVHELTQKLARLADGAYTLAPRSLLCAQAPAVDWQGIALNDVAVFGTSRLHPMDYTVSCDGVPLSRFRSDGLIVATPTGSTAYSFSAGGPILDAQARAFVLTPVCVHGGRSTPLVFAASRRLRIQAEAENRTVVTVCTDSQDTCALRPGEWVDITAAQQQLQLIAFDAAEQFRAIENKLMRR